MPPQGDLFESNFAREIVEIPVQQEMSESFLAYSLSVITSRAIPDVRDGLKPVQRRILHSMHSMGLRPDRPHRKCAGVVGDTMGKYHPHGDSSIYDALTRMGQDFSRNIRLVDPHGNFGTLDDPPAAYRYTECRLSPAAMDMLDEIDEDTVEFRATFDGERDEPIYLPARLPNLLVNGTTGIAVGMATNMAPHNLTEVYEAIKLVMTQRRPKPTVEELMKVLPGPDLPSGGIVIDDSLADAYATGRGSFRMRATAEVVNLTKSRQGIVVTELPYMVGPERIVGRIQELVNLGKLNGVSAVKNLQDRRTGMNITIECKPGVNAKAVLTELYKLTPMEESFGINNVVLVNGVPTTLGIWDLCNYYADHRLDVVRRRTAYRLQKAQDRLHILDGLLIALDAIDLVISIIRSSQDVPEARTRLMAELSLSEVQANHILDMQLRRLTALEKLKLEEEAAALREQIADFEKILASEQRQRTIVLKELEDMVKRYGTPRRSRIIRPDQIDDVSIEQMIEAPEGMVDEPCAITLSASGTVGREPAGGPKQATFGRHDVLRTRVETRTTGKVIGVTNTGRVLVSPAAAIPEITGRSRGVSMSEAFTTQKGETIVALIAPPGTPKAPAEPAEDLLALAEAADDDDKPYMIVTANGVAKRISAAEIATTASTKSIISLKGGDSVVAVFPAADEDEIVMVATNAQSVRFAASTVSVQGRGAGGVAGMKLSENATVIAANVVGPDAVIVTHTDAQTAKVTDAAEVPLKGRGTAGVRLTKFRDERMLDFAYVGTDANLSVIVGTEDNPTRPDPSPESLTIAPSARDLISRPVPRRILDVGFGRW
ncbi:MAG: DNA topoisomerase IV subunit A [Actinobacteria bacterium]|nr:DNA topoisomerase IV subunit A [Actinomycetota bacterium]